MATQVTLNSGSVDSAGSLALKTNGTTTAVTIDTSQNVGIGTSSPATGVHLQKASGNTYYRAQNNLTSTDFGTDSAGVGILWNNGNYPLAFGTNNTERVRINSSGNVGIGTSSPGTRLDVVGSGNPTITLRGSDAAYTGTLNIQSAGGGISVINGTGGVGGLSFQTGGTERARITSGGDLLVGKTATGSSTAGVQLESTGTVAATRSGGVCGIFNRLTNDTDLVWFQQDSTTEGSISVSGTTVSYNGGHLSRWAQTTTAKDESLVKGTVLSNLDEMNVYTDADGNPVDNEQLNKVKVSNVEGDVNVAGVFVNWTHDDAHDVDEINMAMTGDMIIRIAQGVTVARGDLLMSAGDGTAKPQGDDIIRSKTVAKVTSTHVTCTYADGSYCVPCVLMAC